MSVPPCAIRQHVNPLELHFEQFRGERPPLVADDVEIEVEIGCADAQFLFERAAREPARAYVGLEIREDLVALVNEARAASAPRRCTRCSARRSSTWTEVFAPARRSRASTSTSRTRGSSARHHARRMVDDVLVAGIARATRAGGEVFVQTDVWDIALDAMSSLERDGRFDEPRRRVDVLARRQSVRRAVVARAERRGDRPADLAPAVRADLIYSVATSSGGVKSIAASRWK